jgi:hypothetical protein
VFSAAAAAPRARAGPAVWPLRHQTGYHKLGCDRKGGGGGSGLFDRGCLTKDRGAAVKKKEGERGTFISL